MWALAGGAAGVAYPAQTLYDRLRYTPGAIYDVTSGGNGFCGGAGLSSCAARVATVTGARTTTPNDLYNSNPYYSGGWAGLLDCGFDPTGAQDTVATNTQCTAGTGYDGPSGVGAPKSLTAFRRMGPTVTMVAPLTITRGKAATFGVTGFTDNIPGATLAGYRWTWGDGTSTSTTAASLKHTWKSAGTYTVRVTVTDSTGHVFARSKRYLVA
jgi:hypothetical protein